MTVKSGLCSWKGKIAFNINDLPLVPRPRAGRRQGAGAPRVKCGVPGAGAAGAAGLIGLDWHKHKQLEKKNVL
jgi:hypothetical protein